MHPPIFLDGPGDDLPSAGQAVIDLHQRLLSRFSTQKALDEAYVEALEAAENDEEFGIKERPPTKFEAAFRELAAQVHLQRRLPANAEFIYELP